MELAFPLLAGGLAAIGGGTFLLSVQDPTVKHLAVTTDATDTEPSTTIAGRWAAAQDNAGEPARIWLVPLPGSGTGTQQMNNDLPTFVSWPSFPPLRDGLMFSAGSDGVVSWALQYRDDRCMLLRTLGADPGDSGTSGCIEPWWNTDTEAKVFGVAGSSRATMAVVLTHRPPTTVASSQLNSGDLQCVDIDVESNFAGSTICVFPVEVGQTVACGCSSRVAR